MKKLLTLVLALAMVFSISFAIAEEEGGDVYAFTAEAMAHEQGPVWFYLYSNSLEDEIQPLNYIAEYSDPYGNWQFSPQPSVDNVYYSIFVWDTVQASAGTWVQEEGVANIDMILGFAAPKAGKIEIAPMTVAFKEGDGVTAPTDDFLFAIGYYDGEEVSLVYPADGEEWAVVPATTETITLDVTEDSEIYFFVRGLDNSGASVELQPVISYVE